MPASNAQTTEISIHSTNSKVNANVTANESVMKPSRACQNCGGSSYEEQDGGVVCTSCGMIQDGSVLVNASNQGLTLVNAVGRDRNANRRQLAQIAFGGVGQGIETARVARFHRSLEVERLLGNIANSVGLGVNDVKRALYLWGHLPVPMPSGKERRVTRRAVACLYLCSKESKKGVTLAEIAMRLSIHPFKLGAEYKVIKAELADKGVIDYSHPCFNTEDDVWILLDRIMTIGSADSIHRGDCDQLTPQLKEAFGINAEDRATRLRRIWVSSHKCLKIAIDAGLTTGRRAQAVVAACLLVAVEIQLQLTESPQCLIDFVCNLFSTPEHTISIRYRELRSCMLSWARRLPFIPKSKQITGSRLVYYLEDVLQHFGHLDELNKNLWEQLDNLKSDDSDSEDDAEQYEDEPEHREANERTAELVSATSSPLLGGNQCPEESRSVNIGESDNLFDESVSPHDKSPEVAGFEGSHWPLYPPAFVVNQKRRHNQEHLIMIAKEQAPNVKLRHPDKRRVHWIKCLLKQGKRTEQEIISASDADLAGWCTQYEMEASGVTRPKPTQQELDSCELSERDLPEDELGLYLRNEEERKTLWRVIAPDFVESEKRAKESKERRAAAEERKNQRKRQILRQSTIDQHRPKKARSSKLCWDALSDSEDTGAKNDGTQPTASGPSPEDIVEVVAEDGYEDPMYYQSGVVDHDYGYGYGHEYDYEEEERDDYGQDY